MDSLTQITLGAAVGEVVLGRKVGNRAMLWGAVGGTLPDLDVIANLATDQIGALAYHRAISHSFTFAVIAPLALGWLVHNLYEMKGRGNWWRQVGVTWLVISVILVIGAFVLPFEPGEAIETGLAVGLIMVLPAVIIGAREQFRKRESANPNASRRDWSWLFFWAIFTHPLLDCCTTYGTQILQPFSDYRAALDNISVVDPIYTVPFLICMIIASRLTRNSSRRRLITYIGIGVSSAYMLFSFYNKYRVNEVFERSFAEKEIPVERFMTAPTIFNNVLWQGVGETDSAFYFGYYSLFDDEPRVMDFQVLPKNHHLVRDYEADRDLKVLQWFSDGYYTISPLPAGKLQFNDLRFGTIKRSEEDSENYVFKFLLETSGGDLSASQAEASRRDLDGALGYLWKRMRGERE